MSTFVTTSFAGFVSPIQLEYFTPTEALGLFGVLGLIVVALGMRSLAGLGPVRKWVAIGVRLLVVLLLIVIIGGLRYQRRNTNVEVIVIKDVSNSTHQFTDVPKPETGPPLPLSDAINNWIAAAASRTYKPAKDRVGLISFNEDATIDSLPNTTFNNSSAPIQSGGDGTDIAGAIQLAMATFGDDAMRRMVLISDGNPTQGDLDAAVAAAASQHIPIDVMPLHYDVADATLLDNVQAPAWKRENEPFNISIRLRSTSDKDVTGELSVIEESTSTNPEHPININNDPAGGDKKTKTLILHPGLNKVTVTIPGEEGARVRQFKAVFDNPAVRASPDAASRARASAFTFVRGTGQTLFVDNTSDDGDDSASKFFLDAMARENIHIRRIRPEQFPDLIELQGYDAVILSNVSYGSGGLSPKNDQDLATYVHDLGGGLVMIGGDQTFGAGGWANTRLEEVLPVDMNIPAQKEMPKGALVIVMHSCEMPDGNSMGKACAQAAVGTLGPRDDVGVIIYGGQGLGPGVGGAAWQYVLGPYGNGQDVANAIKNMDPGDMPDFNDTLTLALDGVNGGPGLVANTARIKHIIILSDGDPQAPSANLIQKCVANKISISTITVYPHQVDPVTGVAPTMRDMALQTKGRWYGPIENNPNQLPQIFTKEAIVVRRTLIYEDKENGIPVELTGAGSEVTKGIDKVPPIRGMILTARKNSPQVEIPLVAGKNHDPLLAHWQAGLGKSLVFTSDMYNKWTPDWVASPIYDKFWGQAVRSVSRPPMSSDYELNVQQGDRKGHITVEALKQNAGYLNFLEIRGTVIGPDGKQQPVRLLQTAPGEYSADYESKQEGNYVVVLNSQGQGGASSMLVGGSTVNTTPEMRDLHSNDDRLRQIAASTGGRMLDPFAANSADLFTREGLFQTASPQPIWDLLIPWLLGLILVDVAVRRIAWDWQSLVKATRAAGNSVREFTTTTRKVESAQTMDALKRVRGEVAETKLKAPEPPRPRGTPSPTPDRSAKFESKSQVGGDITQVVGGATDKPLPPLPKPPPKGAAGTPGGHTGGLLEAKRRAQQQIKQKEEGKQD